MIKSRVRLRDCCWQGQAEVPDQEREQHSPNLVPPFQPSPSSPQAHGAPLRLPAPAAVRPVDPAVRAPGPVSGGGVDHGAAGVEAGLEVAVAPVGRAAVHAAREERPHEGPPEIRKIKGPSTYDVCV